MMKWFSGISPRLMARTAGLLYLMIFVFGVSGASSATPPKLIITNACDIGIAFILFVLLKPVNGKLALLGAIFRLISVAVVSVASLNFFGIVDLFNGARSGAAFDTGITIALVPFGIQCLLFGYLIFRSGFYPRILGALYALPGLVYLFCLWPPLGQRLFFPYIVVPAVIGEGLLTLWLLFVGVNVQRWEAQARTIRPMASSIMHGRPKQVP